MVRTQISFTEEQMDALRRVSEARGTSMAEVVREAVDALLSRGPGAAESARARALAVVGRFESGCATVSRDHDAELAEAFR